MIDYSSQKQIKKKKRWKFQMKSKGMTMMLLGHALLHASCYIIPSTRKVYLLIQKKKKERGKYWGKKERKNKEVVGGLPHRPRL